MKTMSEKPEQMPDNATDRPLVTFALFAYNQEKYIREAVEGAFAQTYEPLEIILSDDFSSDRTYEIMREMAASYAGPHTVRIRREKRNEGTLNHVCSVVSEMNGEYMVLAAGDDISMPHRTEIIVNSWTSKCMGAFSACELINECGSTLKASWMPNNDASKRLPWLRDTLSESFVYGASSAYSRELLKKLPKSKSKVLSEDTPLNLLLKLEGGEIVRCAETLVKYRIHSKSISDNSGSAQPCFTEILNVERHSSEKIKIKKNILLYIKKILISASNASEMIELDRLSEDIDFCTLRIEWYAASPIKRLALFRHISRTNFRWLFSRTFGLNFYVALRFFLIRFNLLRIAKSGVKA